MIVYHFLLICEIQNFVSSDYLDLDSNESSFKNVARTGLPGLGIDGNFLKSDIKLPDFDKAPWPNQWAFHHLGGVPGKMISISLI